MTSLKFLLGQLKPQSSGVGLGWTCCNRIPVRRRKGFRCAAFDRDYCERCMDFLGCGGFLCFGATSDKSWLRSAQALLAHHALPKAECCECFGPNLQQLGHASSLNFYEELLQLAGS